MNYTRLTIIGFTFIICTLTGAFAQEKNRFEENIQTIKNYDKIYKPIKNPIVFVGSSSIRLWSDVQLAFGKYRVINRGIGGSKVNDITHYAQELIFDYQPRQVVIYVGDNDLGDGTTPPDSIFERTKKLLVTVRQKLPEASIVYISIKASPGRSHARHIAEQTNSLVKAFISKEKNMSYVDIFYKMLNPDGSFRPELFKADNVHMTPEGYKIWKEALEPSLLKP